MRRDLPPSKLLPESGLAGGAVVLSRFEAADISPEYIAWLNDSRVVRFSNQRFRQHDESSAISYLASFEGSDNLFLGIRCKNDRRLIGTLTVYISVNHETADVGILIGDPAAWGRGVGLEAWSTLQDWLFSILGIRKQTAGTMACNIGMLRIFERSGMHLEATRKAQELIDGKAVDILYYAKFDDR